MAKSGEKAVVHGSNRCIIIIGKGGGSIMGRRVEHSCAFERGKVVGDRGTDRDTDRIRRKGGYFEG